MGRIKDTAWMVHIGNDGHIHAINNKISVGGIACMECVYKDTGIAMRKRLI